MPSFATLCIVGLLLRLCLIGYGVWHDSKHALKYTDIDYAVFSDATAYLLRPDGGNQAQGWLGRQLQLGDPYSRETYRYTPLLAIILIPNELHPLFGKVLFATADIIVAFLLDRLLKLRKTATSQRKVLVSLVWLLNPMVMNISTRGSSEAILGVLVLATLLSYDCRNYKTAAILLGVATHFKVYPIIYIPTIVADLAPAGSLLRPVDLVKGVFARRILMFLAFFLASFLSLGSIMYLLWGHPFLEHTYLYHITRLDHRHNFSPAFYPISLSAAPLNPLVTFLPQAIATFAVGWTFAKVDSGLAWFLQTMTFVTFNKVCTSQYFLWYLWLLPFVIVRTRMQKAEAIALLSAWIGAQAIWLKFGYDLEILGLPVLFKVWLASITFLATNAIVISRIIDTSK